MYILYFHRNSASHGVDHDISPLSVSLRTSTHMSHDAPANLRAPEYEDIHELQATRNANPSSSSMAADYSLTQCSAYIASNQVVPQNTGPEVAKELSSPPLSLHTTHPPHLRSPGREDIPPPINTAEDPSPHVHMAYDDPVNLGPHEYEDIQELQAINPSRSLPSGAQNMAADYMFTQCPAYATSGRAD